MKKLFVFGAVVASATLVGCAQPGLGGGNYTRGQVRGEQTVRVGTVESVRDVVIDARDTGTGTLAGAGPARTGVEARVLGDLASRSDCEVCSAR